MRVAELIAPHRFQITERSAPEPAAGEIQVRVESVGVCGSDMHNFIEGSVGDSPSLFPMVLGHEPAGTVVKCGSGITGWTAGDRAALEPAIYCYHCESCQSGRHNVCANLRFLSNPGEPGFFREYVNLPAKNLLRIPPNVTLHQATLFEPLAVALHSMEIGNVQRGETAAVFGAGPIGLLTVAALHLAGLSRIWVVEPLAHRRELALKMGAHAALDASDPVRQILQGTSKRGVDVAIDCATKPGTINQCIHVARKAGRVVITGIPSEICVPLEFHVMRRKELAVFNTRRSGHGDSEKALEMLSAHLPLFAPMITHARPLEHIESAFSMLERYDDGVGKLTIAV